MDKLDLTWGNAEFLYPYWKNRFQTRLDSDYNMQYSKGNGSGELKKSIMKLHSFVGNLNHLQTQYKVVIGNGATQMVQAALYAVGAEKVYAPAPYFMRFPVMTKLAGCEFIHNSTNADTQLITIPNNPDGSMGNIPIQSGWELNLGKKNIYDMCYNWPQYIRSPNELTKIKGGIQIYSLSKATGHAGTRLGWAVTDNTEYYVKMKEFIEHQTCGVSAEAQVKATCVIDTEMLGFESCMDTGKKILEERWKWLDWSLQSCNRQGMFLWTDYRKFFEDRGIVGISGQNFGVEDNYYRLNIGCSEEKWKEFQKRCSL